jgi:LuxR family maltose regulon positive regulatory protein
MPKRATYVLRCGAESQLYEVHAGEMPLTPCLEPNTPAWFIWLESIPSFSFASTSGGRCTLRRETVQRGGAYWYAYRRVQGRMAKRYLGRSAELTLSRLEAACHALADRAVPTSPARHDDGQTSRLTQRPGAAVRTGRDGTHSAASRAAGIGFSQRDAHSDGAQSSTRLLLTTKLSPPRRGARLVDRPHVQQRLQRGLERPLTLIAAPAGFGKTTALRAWVREQEQSPVTPAFAWISLDASDNDPAQFWTYVCAALNQAHPGVADTSAAMLQAPSPPPLATMVRALLNALAALPRDVVLVLDDYHLIVRPEIHEALASLLEHPPAQLHLYLATRTVPPLPLARLRAYDQVNEIRADDLRFRPDEAAAFLGEVMQVELAAEDVMRLAERTDGWIAGLQLAGLSLRDHTDPAQFVATFDGSHRHVLTYLGEEVLAAQPEAVQSFLLRTALLERICAPLCDALTGRGDGQAMLERLEQANLFLIPLDEEGRWYRYHHLFAELLRHRLHQEHAEEIPALRHSAARWLESEGWIVEAAEHLLTAARDEAEAAALIERSARDLLMRGDVALLLRLMVRLPEVAIVARPHLCMYQASALFFFGRLAEVERRIAQAERHLHPTTPGAESTDVPLPDDEQRRLTGEIAACKATLAVMRGDATAAIEHAEAARTSLSEDEAGFYGNVSLPLGIAYMINGRVRAAEAALAEASRVSLAAGNLATATVALGIRGIVLAQQGRLRQAAVMYRQIIALAEARGGAARAMVGNAYAGLGELHYEQNDLVASRLALQKAVAVGQEWANGQDEVDGYARLAWVYQAQGQAVEAAEAMAQAERLLAQLAQSNMVFPWLEPLVAAASARLALRQGRLEAAQRWVRGRGLTVESYTPRSASQAHEFEYLTYARVLLAMDQPTDATRLLGRMLAVAEDDERVGSEIEVRILLALVWQAQGESARALEMLARSAALAASEGYVRLFVDAGAPMRSLLVRLRTQAPKGGALRGYLDTLLAAFDRAPAVATARVASRSLVEPLSAREREVLLLLAQGRSTQEIARCLIVAVSTVKTHLHHLFAKLQAADRLQAVTRARELGMLDG